jgi:hypothetical protein
MWKSRLDAWGQFQIKPCNLTFDQVCQASASDSLECQLFPCFITDSCLKNLCTKMRWVAGCLYSAESNAWHIGTMRPVHGTCIIQWHTEHLFLSNLSARVLAMKFSNTTFLHTLKTAECIYMCFKSYSCVKKQLSFHNWPYWCNKPFSKCFKICNTWLWPCRLKHVV